MKWWKILQMKTSLGTAIEFIETVYSGENIFFLLNNNSKMYLKISVFVYDMCIACMYVCVCVHALVCEYRCSMPLLMSRSWMTNPGVGLGILTWDWHLYFKYLHYFYVHLCVHLCLSAWSQAYWCLWVKREQSDFLYWKHAFVNCLMWVELKHGFLPRK